MENLRVSLLQTELVWEDKAANLKRFSEIIDALPADTDLILLPEMFTTGFSMNAPALAENMDGLTMQWLAGQAANNRAVIAGSFIAFEKGRYYNRFVWMRPDGSWAIYDKRHLFAYAGEDRIYSPGEKRLTVELKGWKICPLICYDLRFPVWSRNTENYDLLLYVANFPERRRHAWTALLTARAIENQAYTIGVNRVGKDGQDIAYSGDSCVVDYEGNILYRLAEVEGMHTIELSADAQQVFREKFPFLKDQDVFTYGG
ncbi:MAG: amidohydrolase [Saprospiraceae bacterium]|nr:amidohydrolase [Saprospiraceae bacterium]MDZ4703508.1 amidohydrolase [Saprospiraceae bacterium]